MNNGSFAPEIADKDKAVSTAKTMALIDFKNMTSPHNIAAT
jgi:hypothetical protein